MKKNILFTLITLIISSCAHHRVVYSSGFSFSNYDYIVINKPTEGGTSLYGLDIEFSNLLSRQNLKVIGNKEYENLSPEVKKKTLDVRISLTSSNSRGTGASLMSVSFDDAVTGRTVANFTSSGKYDMFDANERTDAFEDVSEPIKRAIASEKKLKISEK